MTAGTSANGAKQSATAVIVQPDTLPYSIRRNDVKFQCEYFRVSRCKFFNFQFNGTEKSKNKRRPCNGREFPFVFTVVLFAPPTHFCCCPSLRSRYVHVISPLYGFNAMQPCVFSLQLNRRTFASLGNFWRAYVSIYM